MPRVTPPTTRFSAAEFERMTAAGLFEGRRVELINGRVHRLASQKDPHHFAIGKLNRATGVVVLPDEMLLVPAALRLVRGTLVDPDLLWIPSPFGTPRDRWPAPLLLIEVSDTTYRKDRGLKFRKYARAGIPEYWIIDLNARCIEVCREPLDPHGRLAECGYQSVVPYGIGASITLLQRPHVRVAVDDCLP